MHPQHMSALIDRLIISGTSMKLLLQTHLPPFLSVEPVMRVEEPGTGEGNHQEEEAEPEEERPTTTQPAPRNHTCHSHRQQDL